MGCDLIRAWQWSIAACPPIRPMHHLQEVDMTGVVGHESSNRDVQVITESTLTRTSMWRSP